MGDCCSKHGMYIESSMEDDVDVKEDEVDEEDDIRHGDGGARIRLQGPSTFTSMYTQQGRKGINQDAITVWEVININFYVMQFTHTKLVCISGFKICDLLKFS
jgi:hypothetical protein